MGLFYFLYDVTNGWVGPTRTVCPHPVRDSLGPIEVSLRTTTTHTATTTPLLLSCLFIETGWGVVMILFVISCI